MAALFARRERRGLSLRQLSEETGIPVGTLSWWSWRLRDDSSVDRRAGSDFVEVVPEPGVAVPRGAVVVELRNGIRLEVEGDLDVDVLRRLVGALQSC
jgi:hypothetical protein